MLDRQTLARDPRSQAPGRSDADLARCMSLMLDEIDYGLMLLDAGGSVRLLNHVARTELDDQHPLQVEAGQLHARRPADTEALLEAVQAASQRAMRRLLLLGDADNRVSVAVLPLGGDVLDGSAATMLLLGRRRVCENLSVQSFARSRRLTPAESRVLEGLCAGKEPVQIAADLGVRISTVRTQIGGIREKTGARSIRDVVRMVAVLPPMVPALREPLGELLDGVMPGR